MKTWHWIVLAAAVVWYITERERQALLIEANRQGTGVIKKTGEGLSNIVGEAASAVGRFFGGLFNDDKKPATGGSSSSSSSSGGGSATTRDEHYWEDLYDYGDI